MIGYVTVGTDNMARSAKFYDTLLGELDAKRIMDFETFIVWGFGRGKTGFALTRPFNEKPATVGNGVMVGFAVGSPAKVDVMYHKAIGLGATDEGPPGPRGENFYAGYFRDLDGHKLNFHCMT